LFDLEARAPAGPKPPVVGRMALGAGGIAAMVLLACALDLTSLRRVLPGAVDASRTGTILMGGPKTLSRLTSVLEVKVLVCQYPRRVH
jgi:hypothetical protein